jgi:hypothetical protein
MFLPCRFQARGHEIGVATAKLDNHPEKVAARFSLFREIVYQAISLGANGFPM